jgi:hypothetical protein
MDLIESAAVYTDARSRATLRQTTSQAAWSAQWTFQNLCLDKWRELTAFLRALRGPVNSVRLFDWSDQGIAFTQDDIFFSDGTDFSDGSTFDEWALTVDLETPVDSPNIAIFNRWSETIELPIGFKFGLPNDRVYILAESITMPAQAQSRFAIDPLFEPVGAGARFVTYRPTARFFRASFTDPMPRDLAKLAGLQITFAEEIR